MTPHETPGVAARQRRARFFDRLANRTIAVGGISVLAAVVAIFIFIGYEVVPLLGSPGLAEEAGVDGPEDVLALDVDEYREVLAVVTRGGSLKTIGTARGEVRSEVRLIESGSIVAATFLRSPATLVAVDDAGRVHTAGVVPEITFADDGTRSVAARIDRHESVDLELSGITHIAAQLVDEEKVVAIVAGPGVAACVRFKLDSGRVRVEPLDGIDPSSGAAPQAVAVASFVDQFRLYAGLADGRIFRWEVDWAEDPQLFESVSTGAAGVAGLGLVLGQETLIAGLQDGAVQTYFGVRPSPEATAWNLTRIRTFESLPGAVRLIRGTPRVKAFVVLDDEGNGRIEHHTTHRTLVELPRLPSPPVAVTVAPKNDGVYIADETGRIHALALRTPHPETTPRTLFMPVWYEGAESPALKWQSTGGADDFEPKLSLSVLVFGSLKGVLYALLFSVPLAIAAAIHTALFMPHRMRMVVKPAIEILAAIPSVVVGLLAALWLSPLVERHLATVFSIPPAFVLTFLTFLLGWSLLPRRKASRLLTGSGVLVAVGVAVLIPPLLAMLFGTSIEEAFFGGDIQGWMRSELGVRYDPRNAMVVGFALGFAVVPVIFTIAEDAINNVPKSLWAASEALGASRWQTTWRVVVPAATPGIFAATMLGFGRAVGETMIVLMATGNTPILDPSPFNGMRTIAACIAVEVPEAPHGGTLYRVLFLSGVLLFSFTFICNTAAEVIGHRLRNKYGRL